MRPASVPAEAPTNTGRIPRNRIYGPSSGRRLSDSGWLRPSASPGCREINRHNLVPVAIAETHYATADGLRIAYQQWGSGPPCLIAPALVSNIEICWEHELYRRTLERIGKFFTCVMFDKRGIGLSDRFDGVPTLQQRIGDMTSVMDAVGWESAHVHGTSEGALMAQLLAADHPERVLKLGLLNPVVPKRYGRQIRDKVEPGDPPLQTSQEIVDRLLRVAATWGEDASPMVELELPSQSGNEGVSRWFARLQRFSASPGDFRKQLESVAARERCRYSTATTHPSGSRHRRR